MRYLLILSAILVLGTTSCKKYDDGFTHALVIYGGDMTTNGCGYLLRLSNGTFVKPINLASNYQQDSLGVLIKYNTTGEKTNCVPQNPYDKVNISEIKRDF
ncbi:MAG: hypothetical protein JST36_02470 [Bacteroidetes bacterium]|nr:hypothetical protein [Bacteroidota bacterium]